MCFPCFPIFSWWTWKGKWNPASLAFRVNGYVACKMGFQLIMLPRMGSVNLDTSDSLMSDLLSDPWLWVSLATEEEGTNASKCVSIFYAIVNTSPFFSKPSQRASNAQILALSFDSSQFVRHCRRSPPRDAQNVGVTFALWIAKNRSGLSAQNRTQASAASFWCRIHCFWWKCETDTVKGRKRSPAELANHNCYTWQETGKQSHFLSKILLAKVDRLSLVKWSYQQLKATMKQGPEPWAIRQHFQLQVLHWISPPHYQTDLSNFSEMFLVPRTQHDVSRVYLGLVENLHLQCFVSKKILVFSSVQWLWLMVSSNQLHLQLELFLDSSTGLSFLFWDFTIGVST